MSIFKSKTHALRLGDGTRAHVRTVRAADGSEVRVLEVGGVYQSATYTDERWAEPVFNYYRSFDKVFELLPDARRLLMIGGGGFSWPKHVAATRADAVVDVVEIEPALVEAAERWFFLEEAMDEYPGAIRVIEGDGRAFLDERSRTSAAALDEALDDSATPRAKIAPVLSKAPYDAIVIDAFSGAEPVRSLATVEAMRSAKACLRPGGLVLANVVSGDAGTDISFLRDFVATARQVFAHAHVLLCEEDPFAIEDNYLLIATDMGAKPVGAIKYDHAFIGTPMRDVES